MKNIYIVVVVFLLVVTTFWGGFYLGESSNSKDELILGNIVTDELIAASQNILLLEMLSERKIANAVSFLNSRLNSQILIVNNMLPEVKSLQARIIADKIFLRIAEYRKKYPPELTKDDIEKDIEQILLKQLEKTK